MSAWVSMRTFSYICGLVEILTFITTYNMKKVLYTLSFALLMLNACTKEPADMQLEEPLQPTEERIEINTNHQGITAVKFTEEMTALLEEDLSRGLLTTKSSQLNTFIESLGVTSIEQMFPTDPRWKERHIREGLNRWYYVKYDASKALATKAAQEIAKIEGVEIAETIRRKKIFSTPNDESYSKQWGFNNDNGININVEDVWKLYSTGNQNVIVSVHDEGIQTDHPDLATNTLPGGHGLSFNFCTDSYKINGGSHGSHVAGVIAGIRNNGIGIAGIAGGDVAKGIPGVKMMSCQTFDTDSDGKSMSSNDAESYVYAADNGAVISQNSWGFVYDTNDDGVVTGDELETAKNATLHSSLKEAFDYFIKYAGCDNDGEQLPDSPMKGGVIIFAAGNDNIAYGLPGSYEKVISVSAIDDQGHKASFSNYGEWVDLCAPGVNIYSTIHNNSYRSMNGTSMACPHVSGVAALVLSYRGGYGFTNEMLWDCLIKGANRTKVNPTNIGPLVDAMGAITYGMEEAPENIKAVSITNVSTNNVTLSWSVPGKVDSDMAAYGATVFASTNLESISKLDPKNPPKDVRTFAVELSDFSVGQNISKTITLPTFEEDYYITVAAYNYGPKYSVPAPYQKVTTKANNAPVFETDLTSEEIRLKPTQSIKIKINITEPDGHNFTSKYTAGSVSEKSIKQNEGSYTLEISGKTGEPGIYTAVYEATDAYKKSSKLEIKYEILENTPPTIKSKIDNYLVSASASDMFEINLDEHFFDADEEILTYKANNSSENTAHVVVSNRNKLMVTPTKNGLSEISVSAFDGRNASCEQKFKVLVRDADEKVSVYPTQVTSTLFIGTGAEVSNSAVKVYAQNGAEFYSGNVSASAFEPAAIDMSAAGPGRYFVEVEYQGESYNSVVVKL